jgi:hypothetical protein
VTGKPPQIVQFPAREPPSRIETILETAKTAGLTDVIVIGLHQSGRVYLANSDSSPASVLFLIERAKRFIWSLVERPS